VVALDGFIISDNVELEIRMSSAFLVVSGYDWARSPNSEIPYIREALGAASALSIQTTVGGARRLWEGRESGKILPEFLDEPINVHTPDIFGGLVV
jgi:hypothetical protein